MKVRPSMIAFEEKRDYGKIARDTAVGTGVSVLGTSALLAGAGALMKHKAPDLAHMLRTAAGQHLNVFNPAKSVPLLRSLPRASGLFGKQMKVISAGEKMAVAGGVPTAKQVQAAVQGAGLKGRADLDELKDFTKTHGMSPSATMEKSVGMLSGIAAGGVGAAGGAGTSEGWEKKERGLAADFAELRRFAADDWRDRASDNAGAIAGASGLVGAASSYVRGGVENPANWTNKRRVVGSLAGGAVAAAGGYAISKLLKKDDKPAQARLAGRIGSGHQNSLGAGESFAELRLVLLDARPRTAEGTYAKGDTAGSPEDMAGAYGHPSTRPSTMPILAGGAAAGATGAVTAAALKLLRKRKK